MKLHLPEFLRTAFMVIAVSSTALAANVIDKGTINQSEDYNGNYIYSPTSETTLKYDSITSPNISIQGRTNTGSTVHLEIGAIDASEGRVNLHTYKGNIAVGDIQADYIQVATNQGSITISGTVVATGSEASTITTSGSEGKASGNIILAGANITNVAFTNYIINESYSEMIPVGAVEIQGDTTLNNVYFSSDTVEVAAGANLTLEDVAFTARQESIDGVASSTGLVLGDNVTLTLIGNEPVEVKSLTLGTGVDIVISLSEEDFAALDGKEFEIFSVTEGEVDLSNVNFTFTDGEEYKSGTISATGGSISVTNSHAIPEPTTATLSLLALAALAARRRRKA